MDRRRLVVLVVIAVLVAAFFAFDLGRYLDLGHLQSQRSRLHDLFVAHPWRVGAAFFAIYVAVTGLSLPGAVVLTLAAGAVFGSDGGRSSSPSLPPSARPSPSSSPATSPATRSAAASGDRSSDGRRDPQGRGVLSLHPAPRPRISVLHHQPRDGPHVHAGPRVRVRQPGRDASRDPGVRERGHPARGAREPRGDPLPGAVALLPPPRGLPPRREEGRRCAPLPAGLSRLPPPAALRSRPRGDRGGLRGARELAHRHDGTRQGHPHRARRDGGRLPQYRLRAVEESHPLGEVPLPRRPRGRVRDPAGGRGLRFRRDHGPGAPEHRADRPHDSVERYEGLGVDCVRGEAFIESPSRYASATGPSPPATSSSRPGRRPSCRRSPVWRSRAP